MKGEKCTRQEGNCKIHDTIKYLILSFSQNKKRKTCMLCSFCKPVYPKTNYIVTCFESCETFRKIIVINVLLGKKRLKIRF